MSCGMVNDAMVLVINSLPVANAGADKTICLGSVTSIGSTPQAGYLYSWTPTTELSNPLIANPVASPTLTTTYTVTVNNMVTGCSNTDDVVVTVGIPPTITFDLQAEICQNAAPIQLTATVAGGGIVLFYVWGSGATGNTFNPASVPQGTMP